MLIAQQDTAVQAYHAHHASGKAGAQCMLILTHMRTAGGDWSIGELARALEMEKSTVSARVYELIHERKELRELAKRKDRVSGVMVRPVALVEIA